MMNRFEHLRMSESKVIRLTNVKANAVAASLRTMAKEMKAVIGPWPSDQSKMRLELLEMAAKYLLIEIPNNKKDWRKICSSSYFKKKRKIKNGS